MKGINLIFPHQLFQKSPILDNGLEVYLIEEYLYFKQYAFHKQKIAFHRASMKVYEAFLRNLGLRVNYIESKDELADMRNFRREIEVKGIESLNFIDPCDDWLLQRIEGVSQGCRLNVHPNPQFINEELDLKGFFRRDKKFYFQTTFYKQERKRLGILIDENQNPIGGKWTYDSENRKKYPKNKIPPPITYPDTSKEWDEAYDYTLEHFPDNPGKLSKRPLYPITFKEAEDWLEQFLQYRFFDFGIFEDAILREYTILNHSVMTPVLNVGLLLPKQFLSRILKFSEQEDIPINSLEGLIRQIMGWREFIRGMYISKGRYSRTRNFWNFKRKIPSSFYTGTTGILPIDETIKKVNDTGYCHHIERLMILGNFMLLCEFDPDEVYRWFMELFIDAYDWVMVPNVYGMSQFADGGTFATKPYIGGSNYIRKMSNYPKGDWEQIWDGLFWRFVYSHQDFFRSNPRTSMLAHSLNRMSEEKRDQHLKNAEWFILNQLNVE